MSVSSTGRGSGKAKIGLGMFVMCMLSLRPYLIIIIIEGLSLLQSIPPTTADKQTQAQKRRGSRSRKLLGAKAKSYRLKKN